MELTLKRLIFTKLKTLNVIPFATQSLLGKQKEEFNITKRSVGKFEICEYLAKYFTPHLRSFLFTIRHFWLAIRNE